MQHPVAEFVCNGKVLPLRLVIRVNEHLSIRKIAEASNSRTVFAKIGEDDLDSLLLCNL